MGKNKKRKNSRARFSIVLISVVAVLSISILVVRMQWPKLSDGKDVETRPQVSPVVQRLSDNEQFAKLLEEGSIERLKGHVVARRELENEIVLLELDNIDKQIQLADRIQAIAKVDEDKRFARTYRLNALIERGKLMSLHEMFAQKSNDELHDFAVECLMVDSEGYAMLAHTAKSLAKVSQFLFEDNIEARAAARSIALEKFAAYGELYKNLEFANHMADILNLVQKVGAATELALFQNKFVEQFESNQDRKILELVKKFKDGMKQVSFAVPDIVGADETQRDDKVQQLLVMVESLTDDEGDEATVGKFLDSTRDLIRMGFVEEAKSVRKKIDRFSTLSDDLGNKFDMIDAGLKILDSSFYERGLLNRNGRQVNFSTNQSEFKILLFLSKDTIKKANRTFREIRKGIGDNYQVAKAVLVFVDDGLDEEAKNSMIRIAAQEKVGILILDLTTADGKTFAKRLPVHATPMTIIVKDEIKIIAIDPPGSQLGEIIERNRS